MRSPIQQSTLRVANFREMVHWPAIWPPADDLTPGLASSRIQVRVLQVLLETIELPCNPGLPESDDCGDECDAAV